MWKLFYCLLDSWKLGGQVLQVVCTLEFAPRQATDVSRRQAKLRESSASSDFMLRLEAAEGKLQELKSNVATLGKEAGAAMAAVEGQQQRLTLQRLLAMVIYLPSFLIPFR